MQRAIIFTSSSCRQAAAQWSHAVAQAWQASMQAWAAELCGMGSPSHSGHAKEQPAFPPRCREDAGLDTIAERAMRLLLDLSGLNTGLYASYTATW